MDLCWQSNVGLLHPIVSSKSFLKNFNHALQYSCLRFTPPILLTFSDLLLLFLLVLSTTFSVPYALLIFPFNETLKLPFHLFLNWGEKSLTCQIPEREGGSACLHLPVGMVKPEHHVVQDCFSLNFLSPFCIDQVRMKTQMG